MDNSINHPLWIAAQIEPYLDLNKWLNSEITTKEEFDQMNEEIVLYSPTIEEIRMWMLFNALLFTDYSGQDSGE